MPNLMQRLIDRLTGAPDRDATGTVRADACGSAQEAEAATRHRHLQRPKPRLGDYLTSPVIYAMIIPFAVLDLAVTIYQAICFRAYGIPRVRRRDYIRVDRHHLGYLNPMQKLNCAYCGYVNGLIGYVTEIAGRTEAYWCPIKHAIRTETQHRYYSDFMAYGDGQSYRQRLDQSRRHIRHAGKDASAAAKPDDDIDL